MYIHGMFGILLFIGCLVFLVWLLWASVAIVPQGQEWTVERFGRFTKLLHPGIHFIVPVVEKIGSRINVRERVLDIPPQDIITRDNAIVTVDGVVFFKVFDAEKSAYKITDLAFAMTKLSMANLRTVLGKMHLDEMLSNRKVINKTLLEVVDEATDDWGVEVLRVEIKDISPPEDIQRAMSKQMKSEREKRAVILKAQGEQEAAILRATAEKQSAILEAEGYKKSTILHAEAAKEKAFFEALAKERGGEAEAKVIERVIKALGQEKGEAAHYFLAKSYINALPEMTKSKNNKTIFMPFEASNLVSGLGSLLEMAKKDLKSKETKEEKS